MADLPRKPLSPALSPQMSPEFHIVGTNVPITSVKYFDYQLRKAVPLCFNSPQIIKNVLEERVIRALHAHKKGKQ